MQRAEHDVDIRVFEKFFNDGNTDRVFVDVGAARPDYLSVSALYREKGWRVIAIEPNPEFADMHRALGHEVYQYACGTTDGEADFCVADSHGQAYEGGSVSYESFSSLALKPGYQALLPKSVSLNTIRVKVRRLDTVLQETGVDHIDMLSADVEGWELEVLDGLDFSRFTPSVIVLENFLRDQSYKVRLTELGYVLWKELFPNQVYIRPQLMKKMPFVERTVLRIMRW